MAERTVQAAIDQINQILGHQIQPLPFAYMHIFWVEVTTLKTLLCSLLKWKTMHPFSSSGCQTLKNFDRWPQVFNSTTSNHTHAVKWNRRLTCLWSTFQTDFLPPKNAGSPLTTSIFNTTCEGFQMRYCMTFYLMGHQNCQYSNLKNSQNVCFY